MKSRHPKSLLYDYIAGDLTEQDRKEVSDHLIECPSCLSEHDELRSVLDASSALAQPASDERTIEYWKGFPSQVIEKLADERSRERLSPVHLFEPLVSVFRFRMKYVFALSGLATIIVGGFLLLNRHTVEEPQVLVSEPQEFPPELIKAYDQMGEYLGKSRVLLVGISNLSIDEEQSVDLSVEKKVARELLEQARDLRSQPLDIRSAKLVDDMEKVLIELANVQGEDVAPSVEIVRRGIEGQNLLFKVRMAETAFGSAKFIDMKER